MAFRTVAELLLLTSIAFGTWQSHAERSDGDWQSFGGDPGARRYSPLIQINTKNVASLLEAWTFDTGVQDLQVTPIVIDGLMYFTGGPTVCALELETGKTVWTFRAQGAVSRRGVAYWPGGGRPAPRLFSGAGDRVAGAVKREERRRLQNSLIRSLRVTRKFGSELGSIAGR